jgi:hypothetical protein
MTATRVYTDVEVDAIVLTHKNISGAHHTATVSGDIDVTAAKDVNKTAIGDDKILVWKAGASEHVYEAQGGGGVTDHGALTGLADDDHPQYTQDAEVDAIVATHTAIAAAHHTKYTDAEAIAAADVDAKIQTHKNIAAAHHTKYTDAEAVTAVATGDDYVKNDGDTITGNLVTSATGHLHVPVGEIGITFLQTSGSTCVFQNVSNGRADIGYPADHGGNMAFYRSDHATRPGWFVFVFGGSTTTGKLSFIHYNGTTWSEVLTIEKRDVINAYVMLDMHNQIIKNIKNHASSALSGTKKLVEIDIGGTPYYFEVYPTKA